MGLQRVFQRLKSTMSFHHYCHRANDVGNKHVGITQFANDTRQNACKLIRPARRWRIYERTKSPQRTPEPTQSNPQLMSTRWIVRLQDNEAIDDNLLPGRLHERCQRFATSRTPSKCNILGAT